MAKYESEEKVDYKAWYTLDVKPADYYAQVAMAPEGDAKANARTCDVDGAIPGSARETLAGVPAEVEAAFPEYGTPMPPLMEGCTVLDLCCGSGRDAFVAAKLVGPDGKVIGVEPNPELLAIAQKNADGAGNVEFKAGVPEDLSFIEDGTIDIVISNCTFDLSPDKEAYVREVFRVLKENGEWYFTDVFTARRVPQELAKDVANRSDRLAGAMFVGDFRRLVQRNGFNDPRYVMNWKTPLSDAEREKYGEVEFATLTVRALKSQWTEDVCESYGEVIFYDGSLPDFPDFFQFENNIKFPAGKDISGVCGNVTGLTAHSRYSKVFKTTGDRTTHVGDTHHAFDDLVINAPEF